MKETIKKRLTSKVVWVAALAQILLVVMLFAPNLADYLKIIGTAVIELATLFGVLNNPDDKDNF